MREDYLLDVKRFYKDEPHQKKAVNFLTQHLKKRVELGTDLTQLDNNELVLLQGTVPGPVLAKFDKIWKGKLEEPASAKSLQARLDLLPYNTQLDNPVGSHYTCNSSSHYMFARSVKPSLPADDGQYVKDVMSGKFGRGNKSNPSIYWDVHTAGLKSLGIQSVVRSGNIEGLIAQANKGICTPANLQHRGPITNKSGGHIVCICYATDTHYYIHDPYGELDYISGVSDLKASGKYWVSRKNFDARSQGNWTEFVALTS